MTSPVDRLFLLQEVLLEVHQKTERRDKTPDHLVHIEAAYRDSRRQREAAGVVLGEVIKKTDRGDKPPDHLVHIDAPYRDSRPQREAAGVVLSQAEERKK